MIAAIAFERPVLAWLSIGAWLVTLGDVGGAYATRASGMLVMTFGGVLVRLFAGVVSPHFALAVGVMLVGATTLSLLRVLGDVGAKVGSLLVVLLALTLGARTEPLGDVAIEALLLGAGGVVSTTLALLFWGVHPYKPARLAIARCLDVLAADLDELRRLIASDADQAAWDGWIRGAPRRVRAAIEAARGALFATRRGRASESTTSDRLQVIVEQAEGIFEVMIALGDQLEHSASRAGELTADVERQLGVITSELRRLAAETIDSHRAAGATKLAAARPELDTEPRSRGAIRRSIATLGRAVEMIATVLALLPGAPATTAPQRAAGEGAFAAARRDLATLRAHLTLTSHAFRHAARVGITTAAAMLVMALVPLPHGPWAVLAAAASLQPSHAATWSRTVQRVAGTAAGALLVALVLVVAPPPALLIALIAVTIFAAVTLMPINYFYFAFFVTPAFVLFADLVERRRDLATARALDTLIGGALAIVGATLFWRRADDQRLLRELAAAAERERAFVACAFAGLAGAPGSPADLAEARRQVGLANNNAEDTLQQLLGSGASPRHQALAVVLTYLRRIAATTLNVLASRDVPQGPALQAFARRLDASLAAARASLEEAASASRGPAPERPAGEEDWDRERAAVTANGLPEPLQRIEIFACEMRRRLARLASA